MEPRLGLLEEVQSEADGGEAEEEELWVRGCTVFLMNLGKLMDMLWMVFSLGFSYSVRKLLLLLALLPWYVPEVGFSGLPRSVWTARRQVFGTGHGVREHLRGLQPEGLLSHFYLFPWAPESRTPAYCLVLIQRRKEMYGKEDGLVLAEDLCSLSWLKFLEFLDLKLINLSLFTSMRQGLI